MTDGTAPEGGVRRSTIAESALLVARLVRDRIPARNSGDRSMKNAWSMAFGTRDAGLLFAALSRFNRNLNGLTRQISSVAEWSDVSKSFFEESINGLRSSASLSALGNSFDHFEVNFSEDRFGRLQIAHDTLGRIYPISIPDDTAIAEFSESVRLLLDEVALLGLESAATEDLRERLVGILNELPLAAYFGTDLLSEAAGRLGMESLQATTISDRPTSSSTGTSGGKSFHQRVWTLVNRAAELASKGAARADATVTTVERFERVYRSLAGGGG